MLGSLEGGCQARDLLSSFQKSRLKGDLEASLPMLVDQTSCVIHNLHFGATNQTYTLMPPASPPPLWTHSS